MVDDINEYYEIVKDLGQGGFGCVSLAKDVKTGTEVAMKVITLARHHEVKQLRNEINILRSSCSMLQYT
jgi:serine/threonine protein kinase